MCADMQMWVCVRAVCVQGWARAYTCAFLLIPMRMRPLLCRTQRKTEEIMVAENRLKAKANEQLRTSQTRSLRRSVTVAAAQGGLECMCM